MAEIGHGDGPKQTLGMLEVQAVGAKGIEVDVDVLQVFRPTRVVDQCRQKTPRQTDRGTAEGRRSSAPGRWSGHWRGQTASPKTRAMCVCA